MNILLIWASAPTPERPRAHGILTTLARRGYRVTLLFRDRAGTAFDDLSEHCQRIIPVRRASFAAAVHTEAGSGEHALIHLDAQVAPLLSGPLPLPTVIDLTACTALRRERAARSVQGALRAVRVIQALRARCWHSGLAGRDARILAATPDDAWAARVLDPALPEVIVVPTPVDLDRFAPPLRLRDPATLLLDLRHLDYGEAFTALRMAEHVMTWVWAMHAEARLTVMGLVPFGVAGRLARERRVDFTGAAHEPQQHLEQATVVLAPLAPSTTALHTPLEAMATGVPVVASPELAHELGARPGHEIITGASRDALSRAVLDLLDDPPYRGGVGRAGRRLVELRHSQESVGITLEHVYAATVGSAMAEWRLEVGLDQPRIDA